MTRNNIEKNALQNEPQFTQEDESLQLLCQKIREARITNKLSLESVSGHLHISVRILEAIEEGKPGNGPSPVFFRGLVRNYCQFLDLDKTEIVEKIDNLLKIEDPDNELNTKSLRPVFESKESHPTRNAFTILVVLLGGYLFYSIYFVQEPFFFGEDNATNPEQTIVEVEAVTEQEQTVVAKIQETVLVVDSPPEEPENSAEVSTVDQKPTETTENIESQIVQTPAEPLTLEVEASEGTWISISVDGKEIEDYRIEADEIKQWEAKDNYQLILGNTQVVRVLLNGREIETNRTNQLLTDWIVDANLLP
jgi:cytoskeletal protein RodZ